MATVIVDGNEIEIGDQARLNGIQVARLAGVEIPHYCWHPGLSVVASCRMCLVETGRRDPKTGQIQMTGKLSPACQTPATDGTVFVTNSPNVKNAREMVEEDLLLRHPVDCPICDKAGECSLQDYHFQHGRAERRADIKPFTSRRQVLGDSVTLFVDRCVMCTRCVRFCREVVGTGELMIANRGAHEEIAVFPGFPLENPLAGNVVDLCPVGALGDVDFLYSQRAWFMDSNSHVCAGCSTGCSIRVDENQDRIYRLKPRENPHINQWWMCDEGRYGWKHVHDPARIAFPRRQDGASRQDVDWSQLPAELDRALRKAGRLAAVLSPFLTVEEAYLLAQYVRGIDPQALLVLGPTPVTGEDVTFPHGFRIHAEKCPNRRGVMQVVAGVAGEVISWEDFLSRHLSTGDIRGVWVTAGNPSPWIDDTVAAQFEGLQTLVVQDLFESGLTARANYVLPAAAWVEREGSFVNFADRLQSFRWAIRAPAGVKVEGPLWWQLTGRQGLYQARQVLDDVARAIVYFSAACGPVPEQGIDLKINQLAGDGQT